jgi:putative methyltransferase (TIGR04325 family)
VPPILLTMLRNLLHRPRGKPVYASYAEAFAACGGGYEDTQLIRTVYEKTRRYRDRLASPKPRVFDLSTLRTLVGVSLAIRERDVHVLDFGGACGAHYFLARACLGDRVRFQWAIVETATMVAAAKDFEDGHVHFFESVPRATAALEHIDVVFSSSALQYVPDPYATLGDLTQCGATALFLTRLPLTRSSAELITIQTSPLSAHGPGALPAGMPDGTVTVPITFASKEKVEAIIKQQYSLEMRFDEGKEAHIAGMSEVDIYGYFATRRPDCP